MSRAAADHLVTVAAQSVAETGRFLWVISGGGTPKQLYRLLAGAEFQESFPWQQTHIFWADERCVPPDHADSNYGQAKELFIDDVPVLSTGVHRIKGELSQKEAVQDYSRRLRQFADGESEWPRVDMTILGMGEDGHTASLFPGAPGNAELKNPVMATAADYQGRPARRITLTPRLFNLSKEILIMVAGRSKASTLTKVVRGPMDQKLWPIQRIRPESGSITWFVDEEAAMELEHA